MFSNIDEKYVHAGKWSRRKIFKSISDESKSVIRLEKFILSQKKEIETLLNTAAKLVERDINTEALSEFIQATKNNLLRLDLQMIDVSIKEYASNIAHAEQELHVHTLNRQFLKMKYKEKL